MMKVAVIDMGTNTFHLIIVKVENNDFQIIYREKVPVKIGEKGINHGFITDQAIDRALTCLGNFNEVIANEQVDQIFATATSAIRNARNGKELVALIAERTGIQTRIISGLEEAEYIYYGVKKALKIGSEPSLIMDIGGGSIEFIIGTETQILWKQSFEVGGQRMVEHFQKSDPISVDQIANLEVYLTENLEELFQEFEKYLPKTLIGSSGTFDTLSDIYQLGLGMDKSTTDTEYPLTIEAFHEIHADFLKKNREERLQIPGMIPLRVDMIVVASILVNYIIHKFNFQNIRVSAYALKEGVLLKTLNSIQMKSN